MVAIIGIIPELNALKLNIFPLPVAARPIDGELFTQLYTVPGTVPLKLTGKVGDPLHTIWLRTEFTCGIGFTITTI